MTVILNDSGITFADGSVQPTALTTGTQTIAGAKTFSSNVTLSAGVQGALVLGTAQATTSGTNIDFTGIPSWVRRITVIFNEVSTSGTNVTLVQIGSGSVDTSGYVSTSNSFNQSSATSGTASTAGFVVQSNDATFVRSGLLTIALIGSNTWISSHSIKLNATQVCIGGGSKVLSGTLDRLRLTTSGGTDTFDAGSVNIMYEG